MGLVVNMLAFSVLDVKSEIYSPPFFMQTRAQAIRAFQTTVRDPESQVGKFPEDFKLVLLGEFDAVRGVFRGSDPVSLGFGSDFKEGVQL